MAATAVAAQLTEAHRLAQARLGAQTVQQMFAAWPLLDPENLDGSFERWLRVVAPVVNAQRSTSTMMAANYITTFRTLELGAGVARFAPVLADTLVAEQLATSMLVTGPVAIKTAMARGAQLATAVDTAQAESARAAMRHVLNGGRETVTNTVAADRRALGWARTTSGKPCYRCALYASRGPVYRSEKSSSFESHDGCSCGAEPVYRDDAKWPTGSNRYAELYAEAKAADGDTAKNFRRLIEERDTPQTSGGATPPRSPSSTPTPAASPTPPTNRRLNAGDLTVAQGEAVAASARRAARGEITMAEHRAAVREITNTDSRGRLRR